MNMWMEMSRDQAHGGQGWGFTECLWSPSHKNPTGKWGHWETLLKVKQGDIVFHLSGKTHKAYILGYSFADSDGFETNEKPPNPKQWGYANSFYRVMLKGFTPFKNKISLDSIFSQFSESLINYYLDNSKKSKNEREHIFFVYQAARLQCLNGAYLSQFSNKLASIILGPDFSGNSVDIRPIAITVPTGEQISTIQARAGQHLFSENVKSNYNNICCFPGCIVDEKEFLVGAHVARWADKPELRGEISNGLCLCLFHDRAFELGLFVLGEDFTIKVNHDKATGNKWAKNNLIPYNGQQIKLGKIKPSINAIKIHSTRVGYSA
jgi:putative restriction endonuclease